MKLFFRELGDNGNKPLIILHGVFGSSDNWMTLGRKFAETFKVYLVDQRNHGQSPHSNEFTYEAMKEDFRQFIEDNQIDNPHIIGHSMGGKVSMLFALQYPELYDKLMVVDIAPRAYSPHHDSILKGLSAVDLPNLGSRKEADEAFAHYEPNRGVRQFLLKNLYRADNGFAWRFNLDAITSSISKIGIEIQSEKPNTKDTLFVRGLKSHYIADSDKIHIKELFPNATFTDFKNAGHWIHAETPKEFYEEVINFFV
jgi:esterase